MAPINCAQVLIFFVTLVSPYALCQEATTPVAAPLTSSKNIIFTAVSPKLVRANSVYNIFVTVEPLAKASGGDDPPDTITFIAELAGIPEPKHDDDIGIGFPQPVPIVPLAANGQAELAPVPTTTPKPKPPPIPIQNYTSDYVTVPAGTTSMIALPVAHLSCCSAYNLTITALANTEHRYTEVGHVFRDTRIRSVLIQTDKPIYKPGDTVRFRVVVLDRNLVPVIASKSSEKLSKDNLTILIKDSQGNVIRDLKKEKTNSGLYSGSLELSAEPNLGDWRITATVTTTTAASKTGSATEPSAEGMGDEAPTDDGENGDGDGGGGGDDYDGNTDFDGDGADTRTTTTHSFTVDQYVLPKFKVDVQTHPKFVTYNSSKVSVQVDAMYTYGKKLEGFAVVTLAEPYSYDYYEDGRPKGPKKVIKKSPITGTAFVEIDIIKELLEPKSQAHAKGGIMPPQQPSQQYQRDFKIDVSVTDTLTGRVVNGTHTITMYVYAYKMELVQPPTSYKPGFPLTLHIKVAAQDDVPVHDPAPDALLIRHGYKCDAEDGVLKFSVPPTGLVSFTVVTPTNELVGSPSLEVVYKGQTQTLYPPQKVNSPSHSYMQVEILTEAPGKGGKYAVGAEIKFRVRVNKHCSGESVDYVLYGRGEILAQGKANAVNGNGGAGGGGNSSHLVEHEFSIPALPQHAAPESTLVTYCVLPDSTELISDSIKIKSDTQFQNHLALKFPDGVNVTMEPGENASLQLDSMKASLVALRGVDQSVLVLKKDDDITGTKVDAEITRFQQQWGSYRIWGGSTSFQTFEEAGLVILTNGKLEKENWVRPYYGGGRHIKRFGGMMAMEGRSFRGGMMKIAAAPMMMAENAGIEMDDMPMGGAAPGGGFAAPVRVRQHFPESWLWEEVCMNESTNAVVHTTVPDTITSWYISGYSLHPEAGIALSGLPTVVQVFRPFFVTLNVPYSVVKGEMLALQVLVHNYMESEANAEITLINVDNSLSFDEYVNTHRENATKTVRVAPGSVASVIFAVTPIKFGTIKLSVKGTSLAAGDAVEQPLIVKPPGHKLTRTTAVLIDLKSQPSFEGTLTAFFPRGREHGADTLRVGVVGDLLGSTMKHLDRLLAMPMGCGEQNMLNFVPDIVVLDYLNGTGALSPEIRARAVKYLEQGYQRELTYRHYDGSFSAFGQSDPHGSTWLTAFVVKSFLQASAYITVDQNTIVQGLQYLVAHQHKDGSFIELGHVLHAEMQGGGGPGNELALTSYVLLTFIEAKNSTVLTRTKHNINFEGVILKGVKYVLESYPVAQNDSYSVSLITHVLTVVGKLKQPLMDKFFQDLQSLAIKDGDTLHWDSAPKPYPLPLPDIGPEGPEGRPFMYFHPRTRPVAVEMTSYALMTYLARGDLMSSLSIAKWLLQQRSEYGGFVSTQDTVVGLTALAQFAKATRSADTEMVIKITRGDQVEECKVDGSNQIVLQEFQLATNGSGSPPASSGAEFNDTVAVHAEGKGSSLAVLTWTYYMEEHDQKPAFQVDVTVEPTVNKSGLSLYICSRFLAGNRSNMIVQEVNLPSGYMFDQEDVKPLTKKVARLKRVDLENVNSQLQLYYDFYLNNGTECITLPAARVFKVANPSKAYVHVYDYYDTTLSTVTYYEPPALAPCDLCSNELDGDCKMKSC